MMRPLTDTEQRIATVAFNKGFRRGQLAALLHEKLTDLEINEIAADWLLTTLDKGDKTFEGVFELEEHWDTAPKKNMEIDLIHARLKALEKAMVYLESLSRTHAI